LLCHGDVLHDRSFCVRTIIFLFKIEEVYIYGSRSQKFRLSYLNGRSLTGKIVRAENSIRRLIQEIFKQSLIEPDTKSKGSYKEALKMLLETLSQYCRKFFQETKWRLTSIVIECPIQSPLEILNYLFLYLM
jgi:hypothetical protein